MGGQRAGKRGRKPGVRVKNGQWFSEAGGKGRYLGRVDEVTEAGAKSRLWAQLDEEERAQTVPENNVVLPRCNEAVSAQFKQSTGLKVRELIDKYLEWLAKHRSAGLHREAKRHLNRFADRHGRKHAADVAGAHLEIWQDQLIAQGHALMYVRKHGVSLRACFNKGVRMGWLPATCRPFANVEAIRLDPKPLLESDLPTKAEVHALLNDPVATPKLKAMLVIYHATGCRTHELLEAKVGDFQHNSRTLVLGRHKRSKTLREPIPRTITLNPAAYEAVQRQCEGRGPQEYLFPNRAGKVFTSVLFGDMFSRLRKRAGVRDGITPYSFRHLYISEMLMAGVDALLVAKVAGTSVKMIESVYGHFKTASYHEAQARLDAARSDS